jgi:hypothetical protein
MEKTVRNYDPGSRVSSAHRMTLTALERSSVRLMVSMRGTRARFRLAFAKSIDLIQMEWNIAIQLNLEFEMMTVWIGKELFNM